MANDDLSQDDDGEINNRILSDFSTDPELAGRSHKTWAATLLVFGLILFVLPTLFPLLIAIPVGLISLISIGILFSATPPHLTPWRFAYRRITSATRQQIYVPDSSITVHNNHATNTENEGNQDVNDGNN